MTTRDGQAEVQMLRELVVLVDGVRDRWGAPWLAWLLSEAGGEALDTLAADHPEADGGQLISLLFEATPADVRHATLAHRQARKVAVE